MLIIITTYNVFLCYSFITPPHELRIRTQASIGTSRCWRNSRQKDTSRQVLRADKSLGKGGREEGEGRESFSGL